MPTDEQLNQRSLREQDQLRKKKAMAVSGAGNVPDAQMPELATPKPTMGGTGERPGPMIRPGMLTPQQNEEARRARAMEFNLRNDHRNAVRSGADAHTLGAIQAGISDARLSAGAFERQGKGFAQRPQTVEEHAVSVYKLREQENRILAEQRNDLDRGGGDTDFQAGMSVLPKNLRDQKFSSPQDQANHYQFVRDAGQNTGREVSRDQYGIANGVTSPEDRLRAQNEASRAEALAKLGQPRQEYAPYNPEAAKAYVERDQANYQSAQDSAVDARGRLRETEMLQRKAQVAPVEQALAASGAATAGSRAQEVKSDTEAKMGEVTRDAMLGKPGESKVPPSIQVQLDQQSNALREQESLNRAKSRDLSLKSVEPSYLRALEIAGNVGADINPLKGAAILPTGANERDATVAAAHLDELEMLLQSITNPDQRAHLIALARNSIGDTTDLSERPLPERAVSGTPGALATLGAAYGPIGAIIGGGISSARKLIGGDSVASREQAIQKIMQHANRLRNGTFGTKQ